MFGGAWSKAWQQKMDEAMDKALSEVVQDSSVSPERAKAIIVLNTWKRERTNLIEVIDLIVAELKLREKWEVPE